MQRYAALPNAYFLGDDAGLMHLKQLQHHEQVVLVGLYHWMIHADLEVSKEEEERLEKMRVLWGSDYWTGLEQQAQAKYPSARALALGCRNVMRPDARQCIYDELIRLAGADEYHPDEIKLLNWLALTWGFADQAAVEKATAASQAPESVTEPSEDHNTFDLFG